MFTEITRTSSAQSEKHLIHRLLKACVHEQLFPYLIEDDILIISLKRSNKNIIVSKINYFSLEKITITGDVILIDQGKFTKIKQARNLLNLIHYELEDDIEKTQWLKFVSEIQNCIDNFDLVTQFLESFNRQILDKISQANCKTLIEFVASTHSPAEQLTFFEAWATRGHPYHPCHKTKLGFSKEEYLQFSPEFNQNIHLPIAAIEQSLMHVESEENDFDYNQWFSQHYPLEWRAYLQKITSSGLSENRYFPVFIHPWQYKHVLTKLFQEMIEKKQFILFEDVCVTTKASLSFRTLIVQDGSRQPHIKLPVAVHSTSAMRTISPASVQNGPKLSAILRKILMENGNFGGQLQFSYESCGLNVKHPDADVAKLLGVIYRENPSQYLHENQVPVVVAALFEESPVNRLPFFIEILQTAVGDHVTSAIGYFDRYCRIVIQAYFDLFLIYGIALEGHQQNTIAVFENYFPVFMIARDLGGLRIHLPTLIDSGFAFQAFPNSATVGQDSQEVTNKFLHTVIQYHLGELIILLAQHYQISETVFWKIVKDHLDLRFQELKGRVDPARWQQEYHAIFETDWQIKGLLRMRLNNMYNKYIYINLKNPLRDA